MHGVSLWISNISFNRYIYMSVSIICLSIYLCKKKRDWILLGEIGSQLWKLRNTHICYLQVGDPGELVVSKGRRKWGEMYQFEQAGRKEKKTKILLFTNFCSTQILNRLDDSHLSQGGKSALLGPMASCGAVKLTHKVSHHTKNFI